MKVDLCENCRAFKPVDRTTGECRLNPPVVNFAASSSSFKTNTSWPEVKSKDWCLKHEYDEP